MRDFESDSLHPSRCELLDQNRSELLLESLDSPAVGVLGLRSGSATLHDVSELVVQEMCESAVFRGLDA